MTNTNITKGFEKTGIYPFNSNIFTDIDYMPSFVTDRPAPVVNTEKTVSPAAQEQPEPSPEHLEFQPSEPDPSEKNVSLENLMNKENIQNCSNQTKTFSPEAVWPIPEAGPRKETNKGRKKRKAAVLTDTPEKNALEEEQRKSKKKAKPQIGKNQKKKGQVTKKILHSDSEEDDDYNCLICCEAYSDSIPGENWVQCQSCKEWAHTKCAPNADFSFICVHCDSDNDD